MGKEKQENGPFQDFTQAHQNSIELKVVQYHLQSSILQVLLQVLSIGQLLHETVPTSLLEVFKRSVRLRHLILPILQEQIGDQCYQACHLYLLTVERHPVRKVEELGAIPRWRQVVTEHRPICSSNNSRNTNNIISNLKTQIIPTRTLPSTMATNNLVGNHSLDLHTNMLPMTELHLQTIMPDILEIIHMERKLLNPTISSASGGATFPKKQQTNSGLGLWHTYNIRIQPRMKSKS